MGPGDYTVGNDGKTVTFIDMQASVTGDIYTAHYRY